MIIIIKMIIIPIPHILSLHLRDVLHVCGPLLGTVLVVKLVDLPEAALLADQPVGVQPALALDVHQSAVLRLES